MEDIRQSEEYAGYIKNLGWRVVKSSNGVNIFIKKLPIVGSLIKIQRPTSVNFKEIDEIAGKYRAIFVKIEPEKDFDLEKFGYKKDNWPLLPTKTIFIDLTKDETEILGRMDKDTRYCIRKAENQDLEIEESRDIDRFYEILKASMKIGKWEIPIKKNVFNLYQAFKNKAKIIFVKKDSAVVSGAMLVFHGSGAHFMYAGTNMPGRRLFGAYLTLRECIKTAKQHACKFIDLEGVYDERFPKNNKNWVGFTKFKQGFGGEEIYYPGSFIKYHSGVLSLLSVFLQ